MKSVYIFNPFIFSTKVPSADLKGSYSISEGGALSFAPIGSFDCAPRVLLRACSHQVLFFPYVPPSFPKLKFPFNSELYIFSLC